MPRKFNGVQVFCWNRWPFHQDRRLVCSGEQLDPGTGFDFVKTNQADFPVRAMCRVLDLSPSGYYAWLDREPSARARRDEELTERIEAVWSENRRVYGRPRSYADLKEGGERVGEKRVGRLMKQAGIVGASRRHRTEANIAVLNKTMLNTFQQTSSLGGVQPEEKRK